LLYDLNKINNQSSNPRNPYPFHHHGVANALLHDLHPIKNLSIKTTYHGVADALLHELHKIRNQSIILTHFIHHGVADALLHDLHAIRYIHQSNLANPYPFEPFHPSWHRRCFAAWSPQNQISISPT
jgi:hypothetical protein